MKTKICFDIEPELLEKIDEIAKDNERSRAFILRDAVRKYIESL